MIQVRIPVQRSSHLNIINKTMSWQRNFLILFGIVLFYSCKSNQPDPEPGSNKRFVSEKYTRVFDDQRNYSSYSVTYNKSGAVASITTTQSDTTQFSRGTGINQSNFDYNSSGYLIKQTSSYTYFGISTYFMIDTTRQSIKGEMLYQYDNNNRLSKHIYTTVQTYGSSVTYNNIETATYNYDPAGKLATNTISSVTMNGNSSIIYGTSKKNFTYQNGILVKYTEIPAGSSNVIDDCTFSSNGLLLQSGSGNQISVRKTYDSFNNLIKDEHQIMVGKPQWVMEYSYDRAPTPRSLVPKFLGPPQEAVYSILTNRSPNNTLRETDWRTDSQGNLSKLYETVYNASYNSDGLLTRKVWRDQANSSNFIEYVYTYTDF